MSSRFHKYTQGHFSEQDRSFRGHEREEAKKNKPSLTFEEVVCVLS